MIEFTKARVEHCPAVLGNLREQERLTIERLGLVAESLLIATIEKGSPAFTTLIDSVPAAMFGVNGSTFLGTQRLWLLTTPLIEHHQIALLKASRNFVRWARANYGPIDGMCDAENKVSLKWLKWIGFKEIGNGDYIAMRYE